MGRKAGHDAQARGICEYSELPPWEHSRVHPSNSTEAEEPLLDPGDHKTHLIQVGIQQELGSPWFSTQTHPHRIAKAVHIGLIQQRPH